MLRTQRYFHRSTFGGFWVSSVKDTASLYRLFLVQTLNSKVTVEANSRKENLRSLVPKLRAKRSRRASGLWKGEEKR